MYNDFSMKKVYFISINRTISGVVNFYLEHTKDKIIIPYEELEVRDTKFLQDNVAKVETYIGLSKAFIEYTDLKYVIFEKTRAVNLL